jgi:hypothetical protein
MSAQTETRGKASAARIIDSPERAERLAEHLLDPERSKPVVVVTTAAGQNAPYINVEDIIRAVSELADVYVLPTGSITFALGGRMPLKTQVYGGAGRVYPVDRAWQSDPYAAPLRFAFGAAQGPAATDKLIADALGSAHKAGIDTKRAGATVVRVEGIVKALVGPSRAWVRTDDGRDAAIWQDLLLPGLPIDRTFKVGMRISGALDVEEVRIDVSASLRKSREALADYAKGVVVLGRVVKLDNIAALVELYPGARTGMSATEVTGNPLDRLTALMSVDEVLPVRVTARGGHDGRGWRLSMLDVEDSEEILASPSLLPGGPPWLVLAEDAAETSTALLGIEPTARPGIEPTERTERHAESPNGAQPPQPVALESRAVKGNAAPTPFPRAADERESLLGQVAKLEAQLQRSKTTARAVQVERDGFREQASQSHARVQQLLLRAKKARTDLRTEKQKSQHLEKLLRSAKLEASSESTGGVLFLDPVAQFRFDVDVDYAHRIPAADKAARPPRELRVGPDFLASLSSLEGVDRTKVIAVTVEIITDLVYDLDSRKPHPLREGRGSAEREVVRAADGARCMRVALQLKTPSARRLHYWKVGEAIELSRVVKHDDMTP